MTEKTRTVEAIKTEMADTPAQQLAPLQAELDAAEAKAKETR